MNSIMSPTYIYGALHDAYLRYLETSFYLKDPTIHRQFRELLRDNTQLPLVRQPILEVSPGFNTGSSIEQLIMEGVFHKMFGKIDKRDLTRPLYSHQERALRMAVQDRRNLVIATGTGSGKTEIYLYPIINHLLLESQLGTLKNPGVRALLLYPMNALANDQLARLRAFASIFPEITFGRYTGETDQSYEKSLRSYHEFHDGKDPSPNELICRDQMRDTSPHILFTNYAMLEYLLLRPEDSSLFGGGHWKFLVLDEVHSYSGALGVEIAMLLRRLKERVVQSEHGRLQCIATSATLGGGEKDFPKIANFATDLFGEIFNIGDIISADNVILKSEPSKWNTTSNKMFASLKEAVFSSKEILVEDLALIAKNHDVPAAVIASALTEASNAEGKEKYQTFLFHLLKGNSKVNEIRDQLNRRRALELHDVQGVNEPELTDIIALGAQARKCADQIPLIPAKYHIMARAISGIYVWFDVDNKPQLLSKREKYHYEDGREYAVFELACCNRCGEIFLVGENKDGFIIQPPDIGDDPITRLNWFQLCADSSDNIVDEDDAVDADEDLSKEPSGYTSPMRICRICGRIDDASTFNPNSCIGHTAETISVVKIKNKLRRNVPQQCPSCRNLYGSVASRIVTGKQAPVAVLATAFYQKIPASRKSADADLPGGGRKLMMFSDSRQDAAFFAPFMDKTYNKFKQRRYLVEALEGKTEPIDLQDWAHICKKIAEDAGEWNEDSSGAVRRKDAGRWVLREWIAMDRRLSLEGVGCVKFSLRKPSSFSTIEVLSQPPWNLNQEDQWVLIQVLLDSIRSNGIVSFNDDDGIFSGIEPIDDIFEPRNVACYLRGANGNTQKHIYAWEPAQNHTNKRLDYLFRILKKGRILDDAEAKEYAFSALKEIWREINHPNGPLNKLFERVTIKNSDESNLFRLKPNWWQVQYTANNDLYRCETCGTVAAYSVNKVCPMSGCNGNITLYSLEERNHNHYFKLFTSMTPIPLKVSEHTAQLAKEKAFAAQQDFITGKVNFLSCTTTFELGVDVGDLQAVFMHNIPPTPGNYIQRAGRAGRRADNAAIIVTFAQRRTHDFAYFEDWSRMVQGSIRPPTIHLNNIKIIRRHIHAEAIADYFHTYPEVFADRIEILFDPSTSRPDEINRYLANHPENLKNRLRRIIPMPLSARLGIENWEWFDGQGMQEEDKHECFIERLANATRDIQDDWQALQQAEEDASQQRNYPSASFFSQQLNTLKKRSLIGKLGTYGLMPKYGFPTEVVELKIRSNVKEAGELELQRDMKLALSEYAPGNQVVAGGKVWTSEGVVLPSGNRKLHEFHYWHCVKCHYFYAENIISIGEQLGSDKTCYCEAPNNIVSAKTYIYPEFGFSTAASKAFERIGEERPSMKSYSEVFFHNDAIESDFTPFPSLSDILYRVAKQGWIYVINNNHRDDFYLCQSCGYMSIENPVYTRKGYINHKKPWTSDQNCSNTHLQRRGLGYRYRTDVLELRFPLDILSKLEIQSPDDFHSLWLSVLYAIVNGACQKLEFDERDLGGCLYYAKKGHPSLVLFDTAPGGAGFVHEIYDHFLEVIKSALLLLDCKYCAEDSSCIACLRTYYNQRDHNLLRRGLAKRYLEALMQKYIQ